MIPFNYPSASILRFLFFFSLFLAVGRTVKVGNKAIKVNEEFVDSKVIRSCRFIYLGGDQEGEIFWKNICFGIYSRDPMKIERSKEKSLF